PEIFAQTKKLMPPGAFAGQEAAGVAMVDYSNASSLALLDPRTRRWSDDVIGAVDLDAAMLPELVPGTHGIGRVTETFASATGLARDTCVVVGCGDEMAATLGAGVFAPGEVCDVVGTAEPVCAVSSAPREDRTMLVECHPHGDPDSWLLENPGFVSGGNLRWWRDHFFGTDADHIGTTATGVAVLPAVGSGVLPSVAEAVTAFVHYRPEGHVPDAATRAAYDEAYGRYRAVYYALKPVFGACFRGREQRDPCLSA